MKPTLKTFSLCGKAHEGHVKRSLLKCPRTVINIHIPESLGAAGGGLPAARDRGNGLKAQPVVYCWTSGAGWLKATSYEAMKMKAVNHKPVNRPEEPSSFRAGRRSDKYNAGAHLLH
ncbi:MAG: hypothetical protein ACP5JF_07000 [Candidatus Methanodesulfokora sp.]